MHSHYRKALAGIMSVCILLSLTAAPLVAAAAPAAYRDVPSQHWAAGVINRWNSLGLVAGLPNGTFGVNDLMSKAEFITFVNRGFGFTEQAEISFTDVNSNDWFAGEIAKAIAAGYTSGNADGSFGARAPLTRLEAVQMLYRVLRLEPVATDHLSRYPDVSGLAAEDREIVNAIVAGGYLVGVPGQKLNLSSTVSRGEMIAILARGAGEIMNVAATFGPADGSKTISGNATISKSGITLQNTTVTGDLYVTEGVGDGDFWLKNVNVQGRFIVAGGGSQSGHVEGESTLTYVLVAKPDGSVHLVLEGNVNVGSAEFQSGGEIDSSASVGTVDSVSLDSLPAGAVVRVNGSIGDIQLNAPGVTLQMGEQANVSSVTVGGTAAGANVNTAPGSTVQSITLNGTSNLDLQGSAGNLSVSETATGASLNIQGQVTGNVVVNAPNTTATVSGQVGSLTLNAPTTLAVQAGASVQQLAIGAGASGSALTTDPQATISASTVDPAATIENNGSTQTGGSVGENSSGGGGGGSSDESGGGGGGGGGGGSTAAKINSVTMLLTGVDDLTIRRTDNGKWTFDLTALADDVLVYGIELDTNISRSYTLHIDTVTVFGIPMEIDRDLTVSDGVLSISTLLEAIDNPVLQEFIESKLGDNDDISIANLKGLAGDEMEISGKISASGYSSLQVEVLIEVGGDTSEISLDTEWGEVHVNRPDGEVLITPSHTDLHLSGHEFGGLSVGEMMEALAVLIPGELSETVLYFDGDETNPIDPFDPDSRSFVAGRILAYVQAEVDPELAWSDLTVAHLDGFTCGLQRSTGGQVYTVQFVLP